MRQEETLSGRVRAAIAQVAPASMPEIRALVPDVTPQLVWALTRAGHVVREGTRGRYRYSPGRPPKPYGGTAAERKARERERKDRANDRARQKYAERRGSAYRPRKVPDPRPLARPKPKPSQQVVIRPAVVPIFQAPPPRPPRLMTSQEWEAQGGKVQRLAPHEVSQPFKHIKPEPRITD